MDDKYYCNICNYSTGDHSNWHKHKKTKKHLEKILLLTQKGDTFTNVSSVDSITSESSNSQTKTSSSKCKLNMKKSNVIPVFTPDNFHSDAENDKIRYKCAYCEIEFKTNSGLYKHKKTCQYKEKADHAGLEDKINILKEQNTYLENVNKSDVLNLTKAFNKGYKQKEITHMGNDNRCNTCYNEGRIQGILDCIKVMEEKTKSIWDNELNELKAGFKTMQDKLK